MRTEGPPIGLALGSQLGSEHVARIARLAEHGGFRELWIFEEYFANGALSAIATALQATSTITVGSAVVSAMVRHPAVLAMELASLARAHPGRIEAGIGLGLPDSLRRMGVHPRSPLEAMRHAVTSIRRLLDGEEVTGESGSFRFSGVKLAHPPAAKVPLLMGVMAPRMLRLSGEIADGTLASVLSSVEYVRWARNEIESGRRVARRAEPHRLDVLAILAVDETRAAARDAVRPILSWYLSLIPDNPMTRAYGIAEELSALAADGGASAIAGKMPDRWIHDLAVVGTPDECAHQIRRLLEAGADSVALYPMPAEQTDEILRLAADRILPAVAA